MKAKISLITIWTNNISEMKKFYTNVLNFQVKSDLGEYVEFNNDGVRFALCSRTVMNDYSSDFKKKTSGQSFELAFPCDTPRDVDKSYEYIILNGGNPIHEPQNMPWNQRTALFSDPDGNIHEIFSEL